jgi:type VI secretion system secreted protein Hcp
MAAHHTFLKFSNGVKGETEDQGHKEEIEVQSFSWGGSNASSSGSGSGHGTGKVQFQDFHFTKRMDNSTNQLLKFMTDGKHIDTVKLTCRRASGDDKAKGMDFWVMEFKKVYITSIQTGQSGGGGELPYDQVSFSYDEVKNTYKKQESGGTAGASPEFSYDVKAAKSA